MNEQFIKDTSKHIKDEPLRQVLPPGSPRRYEPKEGIKRHNSRIHKESRIADNYKNLPFTFSKPKKPKRSIVFKCNNCGYIFSASFSTVGVICNECKKFSLVTEVDNV